MISLCYLLLYKPFEDSLMQKLEVFNNVTEMIILYSVLSITNANAYASYPFYDALFISPLIGNICVHLFFLMKSSIKSTYRKLMKTRIINRIKYSMKKKTRKEEVDPV